MWQPTVQRKLAIFGLASMFLFTLSSHNALAQKDSGASVVWEVRLPQELQGRLYEVAMAPGETRVVATTPTAILSFDEGGRFQPALQLRTGSDGGESAILSADGSHAGILIHQLHAISGFRLVNLRGDTLASIESSHQFHYRIAPDNSTFVGIDAGGQHAQMKAKQFIYRLYNRSGNLLSEIESSQPQPLDSAYMSDGSALVLSNASGLTAYRAADGEQMWRAPMRARLFATASAASQIVVASGADERKLLQAFRSGQSLWRFHLDKNVRNLAISPSGQFILASDGNTAHLLSPESNTPLWSHSMPNAALAINSLTVTNQGVVALGAQHGNLSQGLVLVIDRNEDILFERSLVHKRSNAWIPTVLFDASGKSLSIRTLEELILIAIN